MINPIFTMLMMAGPKSYTLGTWTTNPGIGTAGVFGGSALYDFCWNGSLFVATSTAGRGATSPDGKTWTVRATMATAMSSQVVRSVCWTGSKFVAVGGTLGTGSAKAVTSPDGTTWTAMSQISSIFTTSKQLSKVCSDGDSTLVICGESEVAVSKDGGTTWASATTSMINATTHNIPTMMCWTGAKFVGASMYGYGVSSPDGITWTALPGLNFALSGGTLSSLCWSGSLLMAVGNQAFTSPDTTTWSVQVGMYNVMGVVANSVAWAGSFFIAVGSTKCAISYDGIAWYYQAGYLTVGSTPIVAFSPTGCIVGNQLTVNANNDAYVSLNYN